MATPASIKITATAKEKWQTMWCLIEKRLGRSNLNEGAIKIKGFGKG